MLGKLFSRVLITGMLWQSNARQVPLLTRNECDQLLLAKAVLKGNVGISGEITFLNIPGTSMMKVEVNFWGLMQSEGFGAYPYHVHTHPVGADGDCSVTGNHLDPFNAGSKLPCNPLEPELCETGDLSGKYGKISSAQNTASQQYIEPFLKFSPPRQSILGRSVVLHAPNSSTRIACGNITSMLDDTLDEKGQPTFRPSTFNLNP